MATESTTANSRNSLPTIPPIIRMGMKTAIRDTLIDRTVKPISDAPRRAAAMGCMPFSMCRVMFSMTTIASSTTKPVAIASAIRERLSSVYPNRYIAPKVPMRETGTDTPGIKVAHPLRRKNNTTRMTRTIEITMLRWASKTEARIVRVRSLSIFRVTLGGNEARNLGNRAVMRSTVSMMLAFGWRLM